MHEDFEKECLEQVRRIAQHLDDLADNAVDLDEIRDRIDELECFDNPDDYVENPAYDPDDDDSEEYVLTEDAQNELAKLREELEAYEDGSEPTDIASYFDDCLDVEYRVGGDGEYRSVALTVTTGGPHIEVDTGDNSVNLWWGSAHTSWSIENSTADAIDEIFSESFASVR